MIVVFAREHRRVLQKGNKVSMCIRSVAVITFLKSRIPEEDTLWIWLRASLA